MTAQTEDVIFDADSDQYRFCRVHVRRWSTVVAILEVIFLIIYVAMVIYAYHHFIDQADAVKGTTAFVIVFAIVFGFVILGMRFGVKKDRPYLILVHVLFQVITFGQERMNALTREVSLVTSAFSNFTMCILKSMV